MTDVVLIRWPEEKARLERLRAVGAPRLLLVGESLAARPPSIPSRTGSGSRPPRTTSGPASPPSRPGPAQACRPDGRRRRAAAPPGPVGHAVAGRARARGRAGRPVRRRSSGRDTLVRRAWPAGAPPATRSTCTCCACGAASRRSGSRCAPSAPVATSSRKSRPTPATAPDSRRRCEPGVVRVGVDTGGTFTDVVGDDGRSSRCRRRPTIPASRSARRSRRSPARPPELLAHGTTVATNALLERNGRPRRARRPPRASPTSSRSPARTGRRSTTRSSTARRRSCRARSRFEVGGRLDARGAEVEAVRRRRCPRSRRTSTRSRCACCTPTSNRRHERAVAAALAPRGPRRRVLARGLARVPRVRAHRHDGRQRLPAARLPRRTCAAWRRWPTRCSVMTSAGGSSPLDDAADAPACAAAVGPGRRRAGRGRRRPRRAASPTRSPSTWAAPAPTCAWSATACPSPPATLASPGSRSGCPSLDVHTIGAGGGSIARIDAGGALVVGPGERGRRPGPACYGRGGTEPTVTDADLVARPHPGRRRVPRPRSPRSSTPRARGARARRCRRPRVSSRSSTRRWSRRCARRHGRARASTRASSRWSRSAAPDRCTPARSPTRSACAR